MNGSIAASDEVIPCDAMAGSILEETCLMVEQMSRQVDIEYRLPISFVSTDGELRA